MNSNNVGATRNWSQAQSRYYTILESGTAKELHKNMHILRQTPNYRHTQSNKGDTETFGRYRASKTQNWLQAYNKDDTKSTQPIRQGWRCSVMSNEKHYSRSTFFRLRSMALSRTTSTDASKASRVSSSNFKGSNKVLVNLSTVLANFVNSASSGPLFFARF